MTSEYFYLIAVKMPSNGLRSDEETVLSHEITQTGVRGIEMIKGVSKRVIVVNSPDPLIFEKAIFIIKDEAFLKKGMSIEAVIKQAQQIADNYIKTNIKQHRFRLPAPFYAAAGAGLTGIAWLCTRLIM